MDRKEKPTCSDCHFGLHLVDLVLVRVQKARLLFFSRSPGCMLRCLPGIENRVATHHKWFSLAGTYRTFLAIAPLNHRPSDLWMMMFVIAPCRRCEEKPISPMSRIGDLQLPISGHASIRTSHLSSDVTRYGFSRCWPLGRPRNEP